jgi:hypothetical protein
MEKLTLTTLKMMPILEAVVVQHAAGHFDDNDNFLPSDVHETSAISLLDELNRWAEALKTMRQ